MKKIHIVAVPTGRAPLPIRTDLVDEKIQLITNEEIATIPPDEWDGPTPNEHAYIVRVNHMIAALEKSGKHESADYWKSLIPLGLGCYISFLKDCCIIFEESLS